MIKKVAIILGLVIVGTIVLASVLPAKSHIAPESFEVAFILACAYMLKSDFRDGIPLSEEACPDEGATTIELDGDYKFRIRGNDMGQSALFVIEHWNTPPTLSCIGSNSKWFPSNCIK